VTELLTVWIGLVFIADAVGLGIFAVGLALYDWLSERRWYRR
jgi:hypothetical protein